MPRAWEDTFDEVKKKNEDVRRKMFVDSIREKVPAIDPDLAFLTPGEVLDAMKNNDIITGYHKKLQSDYQAPEREIGLLFPDADRKPWTHGVTSALSYRNLHMSLKNLQMTDKVAVYTVSPVLGIVPMDWYDSMPMYDSGGIQSFMVRRRGLPWNPDEFRSVINLAGEIVSEFLGKHHETCGKWHIMYRDPSVHQRIFEAAMDIRPLPVWPHKTKKSLSDSYLQMKKILTEIRDG